MIETGSISSTQKLLLFSRGEGHFLDFKRIEIKPAKLSESLSAFANADGGEIFLGVAHEKETNRATWSGFESIEDANGFIQALDDQFPPSAYFRYTFLGCDDEATSILHIEIAKTPDIRYATNGTAYVRRSAQNLPYRSPEQIRRLEYNKGIRSYQDERVHADATEITNSAEILEFILSIVPLAEPEEWVRKQALLVDGLPTVAGMLLFSDLPQSHIPKAAIKIYRYDTDQDEGTRNALVFDPIAIEGPLYEQINDAVERAAGIVEEIRVMRGTKLIHITYPRETIHEIITNAVIHRDYSINDDVHVRIFNNRIEVQSPGVLPGHVTPQNILRERFSRNDKIVRLLNKFPNPPNKDVGEGLNTAFEAMRQLRLRNPEIVQGENSLTVFIRHEPLAGHEETVLQYLQSNPEIGNAKGREICNLNSESVMRKTFEKMMKANLIERVPGKEGRAAAYQLKTQEGN